MKLTQINLQLPAIIALKEEGIFPQSLLHTQNKYMNNVIESEPRYIKRRIISMLWFKSFYVAQRCIKSLEAMILKKQTIFLNKIFKDQISFIHQLFCIYSPS